MRIRPSQCCAVAQASSNPMAVSKRCSDAAQSQSYALCTIARAARACATRASRESAWSAAALALGNPSSGDQISFPLNAQ